MTTLVVFHILQPYKFAPGSAFSPAQVLYSLREDIKRDNSDLVIQILTDGVGNTVLPSVEVQYEQSRNVRYA